MAYRLGIGFVNVAITITTKPKNARKENMSQRTTKSERDDYKKARRFFRLRELTKRLGVRCEKSASSYTIVEAALKKSAENGSVNFILESIRKAN